MEQTSASSLLSSQLIGFIIVEAIICFFARFIKNSKRYVSFLSHFSKASKSKLKEEAGAQAEEIVISREEVEVVMEKMGLMQGVGEGEEKIKEFMAAKEVAAMFEDKEPSLEELKEAFAVFDENGDGFVDARELQRVLWMLGFTEGVGLSSCLKMIDAYDENEDGRMDFGDFVKFMESSFC